MVPWLLAATITLLFAFQQTAETNSLTSSSFRSRSRNDRTASNLNWNRCFESPWKINVTSSFVTYMPSHLIVDIKPIVFWSTGNIVPIRGKPDEVLLIDVSRERPLNFDRFASNTSLGTQLYGRTWRSESGWCSTAWAGCPLTRTQCPCCSGTSHRKQLCDDPGN